MKKMFLASFIMIGLLGAAPGGSVGADRIRISVTNMNMSFLPAGLALRRGFFKEQGLEAEIIRMNANVAITALASGDTDYT
ncbi:MAG: ABC transporter substrate-binding protein, partial [Candidatus Binatia bacterium]